MGKFYYSNTGNIHDKSIEKHKNTTEICLHIYTTTWERDSHELFDYETRLVHQKSYFVKKNARIFRTAVDVQIVPESETLPTQTSDYLLSIKDKDGHFTVVPADRNIQILPGSPAIFPKKVWLIVKQLPKKCHLLQEGDIIKLGRFKLKVKQLVIAGSTPPEIRLDDSEIPQSSILFENPLKMQCRVCLLDEGSTEDPLVCPCQCKGSIKYIHLQCLKHWLNGKLLISEKEQQQKISFFIKQFHCELCKAPFHASFNINNERVPIVDIPKVEPPFIILENLATNRGLHVISMQSKKEMKLGRGHESDIRIPDVSISRFHATIQFSDDGFVLHDKNSKFGTLVSLKKVQPVNKIHPVALQVGRTIFQISLKYPPCQFSNVYLESENIGSGIENNNYSPNQCINENLSRFSQTLIRPSLSSVAEQTNNVGPASERNTLENLLQRQLYDRLAQEILSLHRNTYINDQQQPSNENNLSNNEQVFVETPAAPSMEVKCPPAKTVHYNCRLPPARHSLSSSSYRSCIYTPNNIPVSSVINQSVPRVQEKTPEGVYKELPWNNQIYATPIQPPRRFLQDSSDQAPEQQSQDNSRYYRDPSSSANENINSIPE